jgi:hypothetical protein
MTGRSRILRGLALASLALVSLALSPLASVRAQDEGRQLIDLKLEGQPLNSVLKELGASYGLNYVVSGAALEKAGDVHCRLERVELANAIQMLCAACNLQAQMNGLYVVIRVPQPGEAPKFTLPSLEEARREPEPRRTGVESAFGPESGRTSSEPKPPVAARPRPGVEAPRPAAPRVAAGGEDVVAVGQVTKIEADGLLLKLDGGTELKLVLPEGDEMETMVRVQLKQIVDASKPGHRVSAIYSSRGTRNVLKALIAGRDPRDDSTTRLPDNFRPNGDE